VKDKANPEGPSRTARYKLTIREVREKRLPPADDDLARRIPKGGEGSEAYAGLEELTTEIRRRLAIVAEAHATEHMAEEAVARLIAAHPFEVPDFLADQLLDDVQVRDEDVDPMIVGDREEKTKKLRAELRPRAEHRVKRSLLLAAIARQEKISVTRADVDREIGRIAAREGATPAQVREALEKRDAIGGLRERLLEDKAIRFLLEHAKIEREEVGRIVRPA
jgi:trigger factor